MKRVKIYIKNFYFYIMTDIELSEINASGNLHVSIKVTEGNSIDMTPITPENSTIISDSDCSYYSECNVSGCTLCNNASGYVNNTSLFNNTSVTNTANGEYPFDLMDNVVDNLDYYLYYSYFVLFTEEKNSSCPEFISDNNKVKVVSQVSFAITGFFKMILCLLIQTVVTPMMIYYSLSEDTDLCRRGPDYFLKFVAFLFTYYINASSIQALTDEVNIYSTFDNFFISYHEYRARKKGYNNKFQLNIFNFFVNFFLCINVISCVLTTVGSIIITYHSKSVLDIILNSLALKFIDEIDNMSISKTEVYLFKTNYNKIQGKIKEDLNNFMSHVPTQIKQILERCKKLCLMFCVSNILAIVLQITTLLAAIWIWVCY